MSDKLTGHEQEGRRTAGRDKDRSNLEKNRQTNYLDFQLLSTGDLFSFEKKRRETILKNLRWDFLSGSFICDGNNESPQ